MRFMIALSWLLLLAGSGGLAQDAAKKDEPAKPGDAKAALETLQQELQTLSQTLAQKFRDAPTAAEKDKIREQFLKERSAFAGKFLALAQKHPKAPEAFQALSRAVMYGGSGKDGQTAVDLLIAGHLENEEIGQLCMQMAASDSPASEMFLRAVIGNSKKKEVLGLATLGLAQHLKQRSEQVGVKKEDSLKAAAEAEKLFDAVAAKYADVNAGQSTAGEIAKGELTELKTLGIGKVCPETEGEDVDGKKFKLSDYRGKVVVLDFWASWCGPCMAMVPHNREMVKKFQAKPFALLGINMDQTKDTCKKAIADNQINWRSWFDGGEGAIAKKYNISSIPTIYVLDGKGVIRYKGLRGEKLEQAVEELLKDTPAPGAD